MVFFVIPFMIRTLYEIITGKDLPSSDGISFPKNKKHKNARENAKDSEP
jgi:hypothetical protein